MLARRGPPMSSPPLFTVGFNSVCVLSKFLDWHHSLDLRLFHLAFRVYFLSYASERNEILGHLFSILRPNFLICENSSDPSKHIFPPITIEWWTKGEI